MVFTEDGGEGAVEHGTRIVSDVDAIFSTSVILSDFGYYYL